MRKVEVQELRYYRYVILFNGQIKNEKAIIKISDLSELKLINKGRMHLFDEEILPVLPAIEYCLHMPRTELDKTLSEMWTGVVATNAIHEIAETSKKFFDWIWGLNSKGKIRMMDFAMERSVGRLRGSTVYADTILVVKEMLHEEGLDGKFDDILNQKNYFPESLFYQWIGFPENIFLYDINEQN